MSVLGKETIAGVRLESTYGSSIAVTELIPILKLTMESLPKVLSSFVLW